MLGELERCVLETNPGFEWVRRVVLLDDGKAWDIDGPQEANIVKASLEVLGDASANVPDFVLWMEEFGSASTATESDIVLGASISTYKRVYRSADRGRIRVYTGDEGDEAWFLDSRGGVVSDSGSFATVSAFLVFALARKCDSALQQTLIGELSLR